MGQDWTLWQKASGAGIGNAHLMYGCSTPLRRATKTPHLLNADEMEKRRAYDERVRKIEHGSFSPLVFSTTGGMGTTATVVHKRIASLIAEKYEKPYSKTIHWIRCKLSFSLLRSSIMCLRGSRSALHHPANTPDMDLACSEGRVPAL